MIETQKNAENCKIYQIVNSTHIELDDTIKLCNELKVYLLRISGNMIFPGPIFRSETLKKIKTPEYT